MGESEEGARVLEVLGVEKAVYGFRRCRHDPTIAVFNNAFEHQLEEREQQVPCGVPERNDTSKALEAPLGGGVLKRRRIEESPASENEGGESIQGSPADIWIVVAEAFFEAALALLMTHGAALALGGAGEELEQLFVGQIREGGRCRCDGESFQRATERARRAWGAVKTARTRRGDRANAPR